MAADTRTLAAAAIGGVAAAEAAGYTYDPVNETWRRSDSLATVPQFVMNPGTTYVDILPNGEVVQDSRALNVLELSEAPAAAARNRELGAHLEWTRQQQAWEAAHPVDIGAANRVLAQAYAQGGTAGPGAGGPVPVLPPPVTPLDPLVNPMNNPYALATSRTNTVGAIIGAIGGAASGFLATGGNPLGAVVGGAQGYQYGSQWGQSGPGQGSGTGYTGAVPGYNPGYGYGGYGAAGVGVGMPSCPTGYTLTSDGRCEVAGFTGWLQQALPGGQTGYLPQGPVQPQTATLGAQGTGQAVMGAFGAALLPYQVGTINGKPILKCWPPGTVLGKDSLCYNKSTLRKTERKWPTPRRPLLSANDGKILEKAHGLEQKLNRVAGRFLAPARPTAHKKGRGRARKR